MCGKLKIEVNRMNELIAFLTSKEIMVVYIISGLACLLCFAVYLVEKNNERFRKRHNTKELNRLVDQIKEERPADKVQAEVVYEKPVLEVVDSALSSADSVVELLESTAEMKKIDEKAEMSSAPASPILIKEEVKPSIVELQEEVMKQEEVKVEKPAVAEIVNSEEIKKEPELQYTSIEPDQATAKLELEKLTEELKKQEEKEVENIALTNYEEEQEENAIISLEELVKKSKEMYAANELSQYADEGNEPISLQDLEKQMGEAKKTSYDEPFIIENVVPEELVNENTKDVLEVREKVVLDDLETVKIDEAVTEASNNTAVNKKFQSSPIISPIYGIEKQASNNNNDLELENTANYDKLDEEIKKTNEFLMTLKELQKKLD